MLWTPERRPPATATLLNADGCTLRRYTGGGPTRVRLVRLADDGQPVGDAVTVDGASMGMWHGPDPDPCSAPLEPLRTGTLTITWDFPPVLWGDRARGAVDLKERR